MNDERNDEHHHHQNGGHQQLTQQQQSRQQSTATIVSRRKSIDIIGTNSSTTTATSSATPVVTTTTIRKPISKTMKQNRRIILKPSKAWIQNNKVNSKQTPKTIDSTTKLQQKERRKTLRRSLSYDTLPRMKNKMVICQPLTVQRRLAAVPANKIYFKTYKNQHLILVCLAFISFTSMLAMAIIAPFFPTESAKKGMRESINGLVFSVYAFVFMICSPLISLLIPMVGTKLTLILGIFIAGTSNILFGLLDRIQDLNTFTTFCFLVRTFEAVGGTAFSTSTYTILMEEFPDNVGTAFSIVETSVGLGLSLGPAIGGFLYSIGGYGLPFYVLGAVMLINIPLCLVVIRDTKNFKMIKSPMKAYLKLLKIVKVLINSFVIIIVAQLLSFLDPTVEPHLREIGLGTHYVSLVFLILSATYTMSSPFIGWLATLFPNKFQIMAIGLFCLGVEFLFLGPAKIFHLETSFVQTSVTMAFIGISYSLAFIPTFETLLGLSIKNGFPDDVTTYSLVSGLWSAFCSFGEILGPIFGGFLTESFGFEHSSTAMGVMALIMSLVCGITCIYYDELDQYQTSKNNKKRQSQNNNNNNIIRMNHHPTQQSSSSSKHHPGLKRAKSTVVANSNQILNNKRYQKNIDRPTVHLKKFTYDGRFLIGFTLDLTSVVLYRYQGPTAAAELLTKIPNDKEFLDYYGQENIQIRHEIFNCYFKLEHIIRVSSSIPLNRECVLFTDDNRYLIVATVMATDELFPTYFDRFQNNESIPMNNRLQFEDCSFHLIDINEGKETDKISFDCDKIYITFNQGIYLYENLFAILSVQHQTIFLYYLNDGKFIPVRKIGRFCYEDDQTLYEKYLSYTNVGVPILRQNIPAFREVQFNSIKHRLLVYAFKDAKQKSEKLKSNKPILEFYRDFDLYKGLRMWKMQLLDSDHILIKLEQEATVCRPDRTPNHIKLWNFLIIYNWKTTEIIEIFPHDSRRFLEIYEKFMDDFLHPYGVPCSRSNNYYAKKNFVQIKKYSERNEFSESEAIRSILNLVPGNAQSINPNPVFDLSLFSYDENFVCPVEKPRRTSEVPIKFHDRDTGLVSFRLHTGQKFMKHEETWVHDHSSYDPDSLFFRLGLNIRHLTAFIFHPTDPFIISSQRFHTNNNLIHFHFRHFNPNL